MVSHSASTVLSAAALLLTFTTTSAIDDALRGSSGTTQSSPTNNIIESIPFDDIRRTTDDPLTLFHNGMSIENIHSRELAQVGSKRWEQQQNNMNAQSDVVEFVASDSDNDTCIAKPRRCGCPKIHQKDYRGTKSTTISGHTCRAWTTADENPGHGLEDGNYCRNPHGVARRAFCFVDLEEQGGVENPVHWDYCDVKYCRDDSFIDNRDTGGDNEEGNSGTVGHGAGCVDYKTFDEIYDAFVNEYESIQDDKARIHFPGGILRLAAHDAMDHDVNADDKMGSDGCIEMMAESNKGLSTIWSKGTWLWNLYHDKYSHLSKADLWLIVSSAVVKHLSIDNALDMRETYYWGRKDRDNCEGSGVRMPSTESCQQVEDAFIERMGLTWEDAVCLLGAHTIGMAHNEFSGHTGTWVQNHKNAQIFDKKYFENMVSRAWSPHTSSSGQEDWTTGKTSGTHAHVMMNTDVCFFYDIEPGDKCCTRTDLKTSDGRSRCESHQNKQCPMIDRNHKRWPAAQTVVAALGGRTHNLNNAPFYQCFERAWFRATMNGHNNLKPIVDKCLD